MKLFISSIENGMPYLKPPDTSTLYWQQLRYFLCSFAYLKKDNQLMPLIEKTNQNNNFMLDSGAFSFMNGKQVSKKNMDYYVDEYIDFINAHNINLFIEADIDAVFGYDAALQYRKKIESNTGKQCIPVWHKSRGIQAWKDICEEYKYIALGGFVMKEIKPNEFDQAKKLVRYARKRGVKVHGLGYTRSNLESWPFYSVDSSSWSMGHRFGNAVQFKDGKIRSVPRNKHQRAKYTEIMENNLTEWIKYQHYIDGK